MSENYITLQLDARGLNCPLPLMKLRQALEGLKGGALIKMMTTDPGSLKDVAAFCNQTGHRLIDTDEVDCTYIFKIEKSSS